MATLDGSNPTSDTLAGGAADYPVNPDSGICFPDSCSLVEDRIVGHFVAKEGYHEW